MGIPSALVVSDTLQEILSHEFVIDATLYKSGDVYHGKAYTVGGVTAQAENESLSEMLLELYREINEQFNSERN
jgi:hypothetical protein